MFKVKTLYDWDIDKQEDMVPWERVVYLLMIENDLKEKLEEKQRELNKLGIQWQNP